MTYINDGSGRFEEHERVGVLLHVLHLLGEQPEHLHSHLRVEGTVLRARLRGIGLGKTRGVGKNREEWSGEQEHEGEVDE